MKHIIAWMLATGIALITFPDVFPLVFFGGLICVIICLLKPKPKDETLGETPVETQIDIVAIGETPNETPVETQIDTAVIDETPVETQIDTTDDISKLDIADLVGKWVHAKRELVTDGDDMLISIDGYDTKIKVRLADIDAPEHDQPWGDDAKLALIKLTNSSLMLYVHRQDQYKRLIATVYCGSRCVNEALVYKGHAWYAKQYAKYLASEKYVAYMSLEKLARKRRKGLWSTDATPIAPWDWRRCRINSKKEN